MDLPVTIYFPDKIIEQPLRELENKKRVELDFSFHEITQRKRIAFMGKRVFDICFSLWVILIFLTWMIPLIALLIKIDSRGPVFFSQERMGKAGSVFICFKFRTMGFNKNMGTDFVITGFGKFLRQSNLDELPQFFNVLLGNMSIVGPRPHMYRDCRRFSGYIAHYDSRNIVKPGITGWAQVKGYHGPVSDPVAIFHRYYWDMMYIKKFSFPLDMKIVFGTAWQRITWLLKYPFFRNQR